jgi:Fic family protein
MLSSQTSQERMEKFIRSTNDCLKGSPYQFPNDEVSMQRYVEIEQSLNSIQSKLERLSTIDNLPTPLKSILRAQEVYESNAIEGLGTDLATTAHTIEATTREHKSNKQYVEWAVTRGIQNDSHLYDVIGLTAARGLSRDIAGIVDRPISEADIRTIHEVILQKQPFAGIYKQYTNEISFNNEHQTSLPTDTPAAMNEFVIWMNGLSRRGFRTSLSIVKAAAVHAWLTHIHPFHDGNGRLARLLANMILAREDMPPLILRNTSHRGRYIDALSFSDSGGDLSKLILVFCRAAERVIDDMDNPALAQEMFNEDINLRLQDEYKNWETNLNRYLTELRASLLLYGLQMSKFGGLSPSEFKSLRKGKRVTKIWLAEISNRQGIDIGVLSIGLIPSWIEAKIEKDERYPCITFMPRDRDSKSLKKYKRLSKEDLRNGYTHFMLQPLEQKCHIWGENGARLLKVTYSEAAKEIGLTCSDFAINPMRN